MRKISKYIKIIGDYFGITKNSKLSIYIGELYVVVALAAGKEEIKETHINFLVKNILNFIYAESGESILNNNSLNSVIQEALLLFNLHNKMVDLCIIIDDDIVTKHSINLPFYAAKSDVSANNKSNADNDIHDAHYMSGNLDNNILDEIENYLQEKHSLILEDIYFDYYVNDIATPHNKKLELFFIEKNKLTNLIDNLSQNNFVKLKAIEVDCLSLQKFVKYVVSDNIPNNFFYLEINLNKTKLIFFADQKIVDVKYFKTKEIFNLATSLELIKNIALSFADLFATVVCFLFASKVGVIDFDVESGVLGKSQLIENNCINTKNILCVGELIYLHYKEYLACKNEIFSNFALQEIPHSCLINTLTNGNLIMINNQVDTHIDSHKLESEKLISFAPVIGSVLRV